MRIQMESLLLRMETLEVSRHLLLITPIIWTYETIILDLFGLLELPILFLYLNKGIYLFEYVPTPHREKVGIPYVSNAQPNPFVQPNNTKALNIPQQPIQANIWTNGT